MSFPTFLLLALPGISANLKECLPNFAPCHSRVLSLLRAAKPLWGLGTREAWRESNAQWARFTDSHSGCPTRPVVPGALRRRRAGRARLRRNAAGKATALGHDRIDRLRNSFSTWHVLSYVTRHSSPVTRH